MLRFFDFCVSHCSGFAIRIPFYMVSSCSFLFSRLGVRLLFSCISLFWLFHYVHFLYDSFMFILISLTRYFDSFFFHYCRWLFSIDLQISICLSCWFQCPVVDVFVGLILFWILDVVMFTAKTNTVGKSKRSCRDIWD